LSVEEDKSKDKEEDKEGKIKLKSKKKLIKKGKDEDAGDKDGKEENVIIEEKKEDIKSEPVEEEIIIEEIISQEDENRPTLTKKILKKGNKLIQKTFQTIPNKSPETQTIVEELIIIDGDEVKNKNVIKRTISNKNRVIEQILEKADNDEKIISQNETTTKSKQKKGITRIKEEPIIFNPESQNKNNIIQYTINKNEVLEEQFELNDKDQTKNKISEKKYPLNQYLKDILTSLGIETNYEIVEEKPKEEEKIVLKGKSKKLISHGSGKEEQKEEDKKEEEKDEDKKDKDDGSKRAKKTEERIRWIDNTDFMDERSSDKVTLPHKWRAHPRLYGKDSRYCRICRNTHGLIRKYGLNICRKCFRERAHLIGFKQTK
jgi:ribosomal protein S14